MCSYGLCFYHDPVLWLARTLYFMLTLSTFGLGKHFKLATQLDQSLAAHQGLFLELVPGFIAVIL